MPLPLIIAAGAAVLAGAAGLAQGAEAKKKLDQANQIKASAQALAEAVQHEGAQVQERLNSELTVLKAGLDSWSQVCAEIADQLAHDAQDTKIQLQLPSVSSSFNPVVIDSSSSNLANETLDQMSWLGGGALAVGGLGVLGGAAVLTGLIAGPALLIGGVVLSGKADEALAEAQSKYDEVKAQAKQARALIAKVSKLCDFLTRCSKALEESTDFAKDLLHLYRDDREHNLGLAAPLAALVSYCNLVRYLPLLEKDEDPKQPQFMLSDQFRLFIKNLTDSEQSISNVLRVADYNVKLTTVSDSFVC